MKNPAPDFILKDWLSSHGFDAHLSAFESNGIGYRELLMLKEGDLKELGVERLGERKEMMQHIGALKRASIVDKVQQAGISLVKLIGGSYVIAMLVALTTSLQYSFLFFQDTERRELSLNAGLTMAAGLLASFLLAPIIFRIMKGQTKKYAQQLRELSRVRLVAAIIGGIVALIYLYYLDYAELDMPDYRRRGYMAAIIILVFPLYGFFQWVLYRAHTLSGRGFMALTGATGSVISVPAMLILVAKTGSSDFGEHVFQWGIIILIGVIGFGLSFYLARRLRLYVS